MEPQQVTQVIGDAPAEIDRAGTEAEEPPVDAADATPADAPSRPLSVGQLRRERKKLWEERQETVYHMGGLAMELHGRGLLDDELLNRRADVVLAMDARMAEIDESLSEIDDRRRRGRARPAAPAGYCMSCGAPHEAEAAFCFRCGARIQAAAEDGDTQVIDMDAS